MDNLSFMTFPLFQVLAGADEVPCCQPSTGPAPSSVRFLSRSANRSVFLTKSEAIFVGSRGTLPLLSYNGRGSEPTGIDAAPGKVNYLIGDNPDRWLKNVPAFRGVGYREIYRGIGLVFNASRTDEFRAVGGPSSGPLRRRNPGTLFASPRAGTHRAEQFISHTTHRGTTNVPGLDSTCACRDCWRAAAKPTLKSS